jgi:hypothetical protein
MKLSIFVKHYIATLIVVTVLGIIVFARISTNDHWWKRIHTAQVTYNGLNASGTSLYRSPKGDLLVDLRASGDSLYEVHYYERASIWMVGNTNYTNFIMIPGWAYSLSLIPPTVDMGGPKIDIDPNLIVGPNSVKFLSAKKVAVAISWN